MTQDGLEVLQDLLLCSDEVVLVLSFQVLVSEFEPPN